jgi:putative glutamine amidotransferase
VTRPRVGITGPDRGGTAAWLMTSAAIRRAGGIPARLSPKRGEGRAPLDALVLGGGADIDPALYETDQGNLGTDALPIRIDTARDAFELAVLARALTRRIPVLGICRGAQLINVHLGGALYMDVAELYVETAHVRSVFPKKRVEIDPSSRLRAVLGTDACYVNALHHQAIRQLGEGLRIVAKDHAGVVQAIELEGAAFCIGVQWHPEFLPQHKRQRALFTALVEAVSTARS